MAKEIGANLSFQMIKAAIDRRELLDRLRMDHDHWCDTLRYNLVRRRIKDGSDSLLVKTLFDTVIQINPRQRKKKDLEDISHEICHDLFHPECYAHRDLSKPIENHNEHQAEMFASLICLPDISQFETEDHLLMTSGFTESIVIHRIHLKRKTGL